MIMIRNYFIVLIMILIHINTISSTSSSSLLGSELSEKMMIIELQQKVTMLESIINDINKNTMKEIVSLNKEEHIRYLLDLSSSTSTDGGSCPDGSELFGGKCWCGIGYKSDNGLAPCDPCDDNSFTTSLGSRMCTCSQHSFSANGYDTPNLCEYCPDRSYTDGPGTVGSNASQVCRCGSSNEPSHSWYIDAYNPIDESTVPEMSRSDSGFAPCNICEDPNTAPYHYHYSGDWANHNHVSFRPTDPCYCKAGFKSANGLSPCTKCSPGSDTMACNIGWHERNYVYQYNSGATYCQCSVGFFSSSGIDDEGPCQKCPLGTTTYKFPIDENGINCVRGATSCDFCDNGWYSIDGLSSSGCVQCPEGETTSKFGSIRCDLCKVDYFSPSGSGPCSHCIDGYGTNGLKGQTSCTVLPTPVPPPTPGPSDPTETPTRRPVTTRRPTINPTMKPSQPGFYHNIYQSLSNHSLIITTNISQPGECEIGYYSNTGFEPCIACPDFSSNSAVGLRTCYCNAMYYGEGGQIPCTSCPDGYVSEVGDSYCFPCVGYSPCQYQFPHTVPVPVPVPHTSKPTASKRTKRKYIYQTHSPSRQQKMTK